MGEVTQKFKSGNSLKADKISESGAYPVYGGNGLRGYTSTYNHEGEFVLIGRQGALCGNMNYFIGKAYFTEHAVAVEADENNNTRFMYYMLDTMNLGQYSDQSAQPGLAVNKLIKLENMFPKKEEQIKIENYFQSIDHLITLHQRKQNLLKNHILRSKIMLGFDRESDFEQAIITALQSNGWDKEVIHHPTEEQLIQNWADILYDNNNDIDRLNQCPLIPEEMDELLDQVKNLRTPLALNGFMNGKTVSIIRKNPKDTLHYGKEISLKIYDRMEIAGGSSRYQIVEQPLFPRHEKVLQDRRGDLMLLINGMPVFHIELKKSGVPVTEACNQIEKYAHEGVFTGLFSLVQIFVAMNPEETLYFANPGPDGKFIFIGRILTMSRSMTGGR